MLKAFRKGIPRYLPSSFRDGLAAGRNPLPKRFPQWCRDKVATRFRWLKFVVVRRPEGSSSWDAVRNDSDNVTKSISRQGIEGISAPCRPALPGRSVEFFVARACCPARSLRNDSDTVSRNGFAVFRNRKRSIHPLKSHRVSTEKRRRRGVGDSCYPARVPTATHEIRAIELHDDGKRVSFDARDWFDRATDEQIREFRRLSYHAVCCELLPDEVHCPVIEVIVDPDDAEIWLVKHRPEVLG